MTHAILTIAVILLLLLLHWKVPAWRKLTASAIAFVLGALGMRAVTRLEADDAEKGGPSPNVEIAPEYLDEMRDALPDDHPAVTDERRERMERGAERAIEFDDASRAEADRINAEINAELEDLLDE